ncbi:MAG: galactokinase [Halanaerobiaceae bacterium]
METKKRIKRLREEFKNTYPDTGLQSGVFSAPGRVNLIGEHTDYNDGFVLPMALNMKIMAAAQLRDDRKVVAYDLNYEPKIRFDLDQLEKNKENNWANYLMGVADELQKRDYQLRGMNMVLEGDVPSASGLSSSAALEVVTAMAFDKLNNLQVDPVEMAVLCQAAENNFVGVNCGIMDQYISRLGQKGNALMIDCRSNDYRLVPFESYEYRIVICNTNVERSLVDSEYNKRRRECEKAVNFFSGKLNKEVTALRDVNLAEFEEYESQLPEVTADRARHVISENRRVKESVQALENGNFNLFGNLMNDSHDSLRDDYEVSCEELDLLVELARKQEGTLGARMTGAGFGGCTVNLVQKEAVDDFIEQVSKGYKTETGIETDIYVSFPAEGATEYGKNIF